MQARRNRWGRVGVGGREVEWVRRAGRGSRKHMFGAGMPWDAVVGGVIGNTFGQRGVKTPGAKVMGGGVLLPLKH